MGFTLTTMEVSDLEKSLEFYHGLLGLPVITRFQGGPGMEIVMLGLADSAHIELICKGKIARQNPDSGISVGFDVEDAELILKKNARDYSGPISPNPTMRFFMTTDPDGYRVQLVEHLQQDVL